MTEPSSHRFFAASAAFRWLECTASVVVDLERHGYVDESSPAAERGTRLHAESERILGGDDQRLDDLAPDDRALVEPYVRYARSLPGSKWYEVSADVVDGLCGGTSDCVVLYEERHDGVDLEVIDFKSGSGWVGPEKNPQLIIYALGVIKELEVIGLGVRRVRLTIVQPATDEAPKSWDVDVSELRRWEKRVARTVERIMDGDVEFSPEPDRCHFCPVKQAGVCPALEEQAAIAAFEDFKDVAKISWAEKLDMIPLLRHWIKGVEQAAKKMMLEDPGSIPGYRVVEGRKGNRSWREGSEKKLLAASKMLGVSRDSLLAPTKFLSPSQVEKVLRDHGHSKAEASSVLRRFVEEGRPGEPTVVAETDRRPDFDKLKSARRDFAEFSGKDDE